MQESSLSRAILPESTVSSSSSSSDGHPPSGVAATGASNGFHSAAAIVTRHVDTVGATVGSRATLI